MFMGIKFLEDGCLTGTADRDSSFSFKLAVKRNKSKREKYDIIVEILLLCKNDRNKTNILYNVNLNNSRLTAQLNTLTAQGLIAKKADRYITTEKGKQFLQLSTELNELL
jgi:predicted transcriptional regulator